MAKLRPVGPDERRARPKRLEEAAELGRRDLLVSLRAKLAAAVAAAPAAAPLAALSRQLRDVDEEIRALDEKAAQEAAEDAAAGERRAWDPGAI